MLDYFLHHLTNWLEINPMLAIFACFLWGVGSVFLSPCHLASVSLLATPKIASSNIKYKIPLFMLGHVIGLFCMGLILIVFSIELSIIGHYWTIPFGLLFLYIAWLLIQNHHCVHCVQSQPRHKFIDQLMQHTVNSSLGFIWLGLVYSLLASTCVFAFLAPIFLATNSQSMSFAISLNAAFAIGHTLPVFIMGVLAVSLHKLMSYNNGIFMFIRRIVAVLCICIGAIFILHPLVELLGFHIHGINCNH